MKAGVVGLGTLLAGVCLWGQTPAAPKEPAAETAGDEAINRAGGLPPRASPAEYQFRVQAGKVTIAAEFMGHGVPTLEGGPYSDEDYVIVEAALFGPAGMRLAMSYQDFSLRINGKKMATPGAPYVTVFHSLKDPDWEPPEKKQGGTTVVNGGATGQNSDLPHLSKMPIEMLRAMQQRVMKVSMGEGDRPLPQAGLLYFDYSGDIKKIRSMELIYEGPAGKATLTLR